MSTQLADELTVRVSHQEKKSSGFVYPNTTHTYILTAKHAVCIKDAEECRINKKLKCEKCALAKTTKTKILIDRPDVDNFEKIKVKDVLFCENKDIAVLVVKDECHAKLVNLPKVEIVSAIDVVSADNFLSCGYPKISDHEETLPIFYTNYVPFRTRFSIRILNDSISNLECSKTNLAGNSGAGILQVKEGKAFLFGIYTDTTGIGTGFCEIIDEEINDLLVSKGYPKLQLKKKSNGFEVLIKNKFKECFSRIEHDIKLDNNREINLYRLSLDGKEYNYEFINKRITHCIPYFSLSRKQIKQSIVNDEFNAVVIQSAKDFLKLESNDKIPEILLQGFLETYCDAPRLYSAHYNESSVFQGAHIKFTDSLDKKLEIIHCIALFSPVLKNSFNYVIKSIIDKYPKVKPYGGLVDNNFLDETYTEEESKVLAQLLIPNSSDISYNYVDRLAVFIGYDKAIESNLIFLQQNEFKSELEKVIVEDLNASIDDLKVELDKIKALKACIDCFFVPFEDTNKFNQNFFESLK
ncbi:Hachiman antiphage defense system protein HamA [Acinetobacter lactucae]|uniref:Hachiman antiphage defense system protein HamA n=1 Tax=Acinetobacter lactucae TaxID=1785128 RepID=UPI00077E31A2|nr:Hachiman antiphage defense system protein HamA [Acinetobacter lactucae]